MFDKLLKIILVGVSVVVFGYFFYNIPKSDWLLLYNKYFPCERPIPYSLGSFDKRFGLAEKDFLAIVAEAEAIWEKPIGINLFEYEALVQDNLQVNLIYDYRQEATMKIHDLGLAVSDTRASYNDLKAKYDSWQRIYLADKAKYEVQIADFKKKQDAYNKEVESWNKKGGAPRNVYDELNADAKNLKILLASIKELENKINTEASNINSLVVVINKQAEALNINVAALNIIGKERGEEFTEGEYKSDVGGQEIDIYEFSTKEKLKRVLAHELGHALGLDHVEDPKAIMYKLNQGKGTALAPDDLAVVKAYCQIK